MRMAIKSVVRIKGLENQVPSSSGNDWATGYITVAANRGFLESMRIYKGQPISRADMAVLLCNAFYRINTFGNVQNYRDSVASDYILMIPVTDFIYIMIYKERELSDGISY